MASSTEPEIRMHGGEEKTHNFAVERTRFARGIVDDAWILIRDGGSGFGLFVFLGRREGRPGVVEVFSHDECCVQSYALALLRPGRTSRFVGAVLNVRQASRRQ